MSNVVSLFNDTQKYEERPVVVLADDDPSIRLMIRHVLESEEFDIVEAADGIEAIKAVEKHHPALVLLDAVMPGIDGFTTCKQIKDKGYTDVPVMMITGLDDDASVERAYDVGAIDFITKPIKWAVLKHRVRSVVSTVVAECKVELLAYRDSLTNLPNRLLFADRLEQAISRAERQKESVALLIVDIDDFKLINDTLGHDTGDLVTDILLVQLNPINSDTVPTSAQEIMDRLNVLTFNASLMREMRAINFVTRLIDDGFDHGGRLKRLLLHVIHAEDVMAELGVSSKLNADRAFLEHLFEVGRARTETWLAAHFNRLGQESTIDIEEMYL